MELSGLDYRADIPARREPFFGPGICEAAAWLFGFTATFSALYYFRVI